MCVNMAVSDPFFARQAVEKWIPLRFCPLFHSLYDADDANPPLLLTLPLIGRQVVSNGFITQIFLAQDTS